MAEGWAGRRVWVTGGRGFLGGFVCERLEAQGAEVLAPPRSELDIRDVEATGRAFEAERPHVVIHLAAEVGGIGANEKHPGTFFRDNALMGVSVLDASRRAEVERLVVVGTVCAYPNDAKVPFHEDDLWAGYPEETNAPYGVAKRALATGLEAYGREFGLKGAYLLPANLYGPKDDFDLETSHVIPAIIRKCEEARLSNEGWVSLWGTGSASREFLYVEDCADAIVAAAATCDDPQPINLGTGREITIKGIAHLVQQATDYEGAFTWDVARPDGQPRRALDVTRARERLGWRASTSLEEGLRKTVEWYREHTGVRAPAPRE